MWDILKAFGVELLINLFGFIMVMAGSIFAVAAAAIPIVADFSMAIACMFLPLCIAVWPVSNSWALSAINTSMGAAMTGVATAFFIKLYIGLIAAAIPIAAAQMTGAEAGVFMPVIGAMLGMICIYFIGFYILGQIPGVVSSVFGGVSLNGALAAVAGMKGAASSIGKAAVTAGKAGGGAAIGAAAARANMKAGGGAASRMSSSIATLGGATKGAGAALFGGNGAGKSLANATRATANAGKNVPMKGGKGATPAAAPAAPASASTTPSKDPLRVAG